MTTLITLSEDEFDDAYPLVPNHLNLNASWVIGEGPGCLFETYGAELDFVRAQDPRTVWTLIDEGDLCLVSGYHFVNRIGFLISTKPVEPDVIIECRIAMDSEFGEGE